VSVPYQAQLSDDLLVIGYLLLFDRKYISFMTGSAAGWDNGINCYFDSFLSIPNAQPTQSVDETTMTDRRTGDIGFIFR
jgi:hypothetical protein